MTALFMMMKKSKWSVSEQASFLKKTGELLKRGYPIAEAIESVSYHLSDNRKAELIICLKLLKDGQPFHFVLHNLRFHPDLIGYVYFAEQHGSLSTAILGGSEILLKRDKDMQRLRKLLYYPFALIIMTFLLIIFVKRTLLPRFTTLFITMNLEANFFTKLVISISRFMPTFLIFFVSIILFSGCYYIFSFRKLPILAQKKRLISIPLIGKILTLLYSHYFSLQMSYLLSGGLSVNEALTLFEENTSQIFYSQIGERIKEMLVKGEQLEEILFSLAIFEKELPRIIKHGQENGKMEQELFFYSEYCLALLEEKIEKGMKTIQPILYTFIGILIVSMYLAILLPMFHLLDGI